MKSFLIFIVLMLTTAACKNKPNTSNMNNSNANFQSGYSNVNGIKMYYEIYGEGQPLVLVHGGGSTIQSSFGSILPLLAKKYKVIGMDLQAHGRTEDRNTPESFEQDADDIAALLQNLKISKASLLGFSNGGNTAMQFYNRHPQMAGHLILASTFYKKEGFPPGFFEGMKGATIDVMPQPLKDAFLKVNADTAKLQNMFNKDKQRMLDFADWDDTVLTKIKAPVLIMCGDRDVVSTVHAALMHGLIEGSRLIIFPSQHGSYLGAVESAAPSEETLAYTAYVINDFLSGKLK